MIHAGDCIENVAEQRDYVVDGTWSDHIRMYRVTDQSFAVRVAIDEHTGEIMASAVWKLVQCPHTPTENPAPATDSDGRTYYLTVAAAMEYRLEDTYRAVCQALEASAESQGHVTEHRLTWIKGAIERTAERIATMDVPRSALAMTGLRDEIYANRK